MAVSSPRKLTYDDFCRIPDDGQRHEILDGVHYVSPTPVPHHQRLVHRLTLRIGNYVEAHQAGEFFGTPLDILLSPHDIVEPDLQFIARERMAILGEKNVQGAPDLVVEVLSPSTRRIDLGLKRARYERLGVGEYWIVDPKDDTVLIYRREAREAAAFLPPLRLAGASGEVLTSPLFPGLEISLLELFAR